MTKKQHERKSMRSLSNKLSVEWWPFRLWIQLSALTLRLFFHWRPWLIRAHIKRRRRWKIRQRVKLQLTSSQQSEIRIHILSHERLLTNYLMTPTWRHPSQHSAQLPLPDTSYTELSSGPLSGRNWQWPAKHPLKQKDTCLVGASIFGLWPLH